MKRFWNEVTVAPQTEGPHAAGPHAAGPQTEGWQVMLDARPLKTQGGAAQVVPGKALAEMLGAEWRDCGETIDPRGFPLRDLADFAIDKVRAGRAATITRLLDFAQTDTLCYRADPDEPLYRHQLGLWEPVLTACEARHNIRLERISGITHRPQPPATLAALRERLAGEDEFTLAALTTLASLAASLSVALAMLEPGADAAALFAASNAEEDWQAGLWGWEEEAERVRAARLAAFEAAAAFLRAASA